MECSVLGTNEKSVQHFVRKSWRDEDTWETEVNPRGQYLIEIRREMLDWTLLARDRD